MKDGIIKATGNSRLLKAPASIPATYAEFRTALLAGTLPVDLLYNAIGWDVEGTALNKANLLTDAVAEALGLTSDDPTVNEALNALLAVATTVRNGLMSAADKTKLDGVADNANNYVHPTTAGNKHVPAGGAADNILGYSAAGTSIWIQQLAEKALLSAATSALYGVTNVDAALALIPPKKTIVLLTASGSWTPPRVPLTVDIFMISGGGGGAAGGSNVSGGGGGGGYAKHIYNHKIVSATPISYVIGAGGTGGTGKTNSANRAGGAGGITTFGIFSTLQGGGGASRTNYTDGQQWGGKGGAGGGAGNGYRNPGVSGFGGNAANTSDDFGTGIYDNTQGGYCELNGILYGGSGGGGSSDPAYPGGAGGAGGGGAGGDVSTNGGNATGPGGGGGGGGDGNGTDASAGTGGNGASGIIVIAY